MTGIMAKKPPPYLNVIMTTQTLPEMTGIMTENTSSYLTVIITT
jgi:hypothetical protein